MSLEAVGITEVSYDMCDTVDTSRSQERYSNALARSPGWILWQRPQQTKFELIFTNLPASENLPTKVHTARMNTRRQFLDRQAR